MDYIFEKLAFINVFHSRYVLIHVLRFSRGRRLKVCKIRKIITCFDNCLNNVQFYFWIDQPLFFHLHITFNIRYTIGLELSAVT
jgi:hypothetical protein